jgi:hypothetical protein
MDAGQKSGNRISASLTSFRSRKQEKARVLPPRPFRESSLR